MRILALVAVVVLGACGGGDNIELDGQYEIIWLHDADTAAPSYKTITVDGADATFTSLFEACPPVTTAVTNETLGAVTLDCFDARYDFPDVAFVAENIDLGDGNDFVEIQTDEAQVHITWSGGEVDRPVHFKAGRPR